MASGQDAGGGARALERMERGEGLWGRAGSSDPFGTAGCGGRGYVKGRWRGGAVACRGGAG